MLCELILAGAMALCPDFFEVSLAVHSYKLDRPEITGIGNPVFIGSVHWQLIEGKKAELSLFAEHTSGVSTFEEGFGLNTIGLRYKHEL